MKKISLHPSYLILALALFLLFLPPDVQLPLPAHDKSTEPHPPGPPLLETFQGTPQLSLFPRLGDYRPEDGEERLLFWRAYREHLLRLSGVVKENPGSGNRVFNFRGIKGIDSVGHFAPLKIKPNTAYKLRLRLNTQLPEGATTGVGLLEFRQFLWLGEQYPESLHKEIFLDSQELLRITQTDGWQDFELSFTSGPQTEMIHLVLFREGPASDRNPVLVDDITVLEDD